MADRADSMEFTPEQLQQHPDALLLLTLLGCLMLAILIGSLAMAVYTGVRMWLGKPLLRVEPWTPRVWGLVDLILIAILLVVAQIFSLRLWSHLAHFDLKRLREEGDFPLSAMAAGSLSYLVVMALAIGWLVLRYGVSLAHIGFSTTRLRSNLSIGVGAALLSLPVVYLVMGLVSAGLEKEYEHPLLDRMTEDGSASAFLLGLFCAVIAAPISEEFLFRVLLQGWLQSIPSSWNSLWWLTGASEEARGTRGQGETLALGEHVPGEPIAPIPGSERLNPYAYSVPRPPALQADTPTELLAASPTDVPHAQTPPIWPVFVSGTLFGLAHWGYGLSFVPLILLGIILGFLYRATHSIWPGFVVHFILNLIAIISLGVMTYVKTVVQ